MIKLLLQRKYYLYYFAIIFAFTNGICLGNDKVKTVQAKYISKPKETKVNIDTTAPVIKPVPKPGFFKDFPSVKLTSNEKANIYYTLDNTTPTQKSKLYKNPILISNEGKNTITYFAEDLAGNISEVQKATYTIDRTPPNVSYDPEGGKFNTSVAIRVVANEDIKCFYSTKETTSQYNKWFSDSLVIDSSCNINMFCVDKAGNKSKVKKFEFFIRKKVPTVKIKPNGGIYKKPIRVTITCSDGASVFYSFDKFTPTSSYLKYTEPLLIKDKKTELSFYAKDSFSNQSNINTVFFTIDTMPPNVKFLKKIHNNSNQISLKTNERAKIYYSVNNQTFKEYTKPFSVPTKGVTKVKYYAIDVAGNKSKLRHNIVSYDNKKPIVTINHKGGNFNHHIKVLLKTNEPADIYYTTDKTEPNEESLKYSNKISISRIGETVLRYRARDLGGNWSKTYEYTFNIDTRKPLVKAKIENIKKDNKFRILLKSNKKHTKIYYEINNTNPTLKSNIYKKNIIVKQGQYISYFAIDQAGNRSHIYVLKDLISRAIKLEPIPGAYNKDISLKLYSKYSKEIFFRMYKPNSSTPTFSRYRKPIAMSGNGVFIIEYYAKNNTGIVSTIRKETYIIDKTVPKISVYIRKNKNSPSVTVNFIASENVSIYYTLDGTNPANSSNTHVAANKYFTNRDEIQVIRKEGVVLSFFAEDIAKNRSPITKYNLGSPVVIPNIPAGEYNSIQSVVLNTIDKTKIFYTTDNSTPTIKSNVFSKPIIISSTTKLKYFAIDETGYSGNIDSALYLIDLPPEPEFSITPNTCYAGDTVNVNMDNTYDNETAKNKLIYSFDWDNDGTIDTSLQYTSNLKHVFTKSGLAEVYLEVTDKKGQKSSIIKKFFVGKVCPNNMIFIVKNNEESFCIDKYEWPNTKGKIPVTGKNWIEASVLCDNVGKRLCTAEEWIWSCKGGSNNKYPYGNNYKKDVCNSQSNSPSPSGTYNNCTNSFGVVDMTGNVWEWVDQNKGEAYYIAGGSYSTSSFGKCNQLFPSKISTSDKKVGFRCCK